ncbi:hypothetical protein PMAYCL1PPCAC_09924, partial [Pristionchus mayeri]
LFVAPFLLSYATAEKPAKCEIMATMTAITEGAPDDWDEKDRKAFDQFMANVIKGQLLNVPEEMSKLEGQSCKAFKRLAPVTDYLSKGYAKVTHPEAKKFIMESVPAVTSDGVGIGWMVSIPYNFYMLPDEARDNIYKAFPDLEWD